MPSLPWIPVNDFALASGWLDASQSNERARWYCEQLEEGQILLFHTFPYDFPEHDRQFILSQRWAEARLHKNVSYRPTQDVLRGFSGDEPSLSEMRRVMRSYSAQVIQFLARFLLPYAGRWSLDFASFRPLEEEGRQLPLHKRNDLLHVDAFPSRPTRGSRILRVFTNLHPTKARVWLTTDRFGELAKRFAFEAGLPQLAGGGSFLRRKLLRLGRALGFPGGDRSPYDRFMLRFHDYLKENSAFQADCPKYKLEFPPLATWLVFSDGVPHAVVSGQFALEQTVLVHPSALVAPQHAPIRVLESLCGCPLSG